MIERIRQELDIQNRQRDANYQRLRSRAHGSGVMFDDHLKCAQSAKRPNLLMCRDSSALHRPPAHLSYAVLHLRCHQVAGTLSLKARTLEHSGSLHLGSSLQHMESRSCRSRSRSRDLTPPRKPAARFPSTQFSFCCFLSNPINPSGHSVIFVPPPAATT